jgi:putative transposase
MPFWQLYYHIVWSTYRREPLISQHIESRVHEIVRDAANRHGLKVHAIGGTDDHIHLVVEAPPTTELASAIGRVKGASSYEVNRTVMSSTESTFSWQAEYGVMSFARAQLDAVCRYVGEQRDHHNEGVTRETLELTRPNGISDNESGSEGGETEA